MNNRIKKTYKQLAILILCAGMLSCKTSREVVRVENLKPIGINRLLNNLEKNAFNYKEMELSRISCQYESKNQSVSFRATVKAINNKAIQVSLNKMNVPVGKALLTHDSIKFVNFIEKTYLLDDYDYLSDLLNIDLDFETVNAIFSNNAFSFHDDKRNNDFREFTSAVDSGMYVLRSVKNRKFDKIIRKGKDKKADRLKKRSDDGLPVLQTMYIDSKFKLRKIVLDDQLNKRTGIITFSEFMKISGQSYPGEINMQFTDPRNRLQIKIKIGKLTMEKDQNLNFKIPERYEPIN
ncbi:MAG: DUF4292 domain-containing protein [Prolixibacteraceae bacterium]|nr:DUF4292 domain-containing protein [Prolixibacteraceae bacterium]